MSRRPLCLGDVEHPQAVAGLEAVLDVLGRGDDLGLGAVVEADGHEPGLDLGRARHDAVHHVGALGGERDLVGQVGRARPERDEPDDRQQQRRDEDRGQGEPDPARRGQRRTASVGVAVGSASRRPAGGPGRAPCSGGPAVREVRAPWRAVPVRDPRSPGALLVGCCGRLMTPFGSRWAHAQDPPTLENENGYRWVRRAATATSGDDRGPGDRRRRAPGPLREMRGLAPRCGTPQRAAKITW